MFKIEKLYQESEDCTLAAAAVFLSIVRMVSWLLANILSLRWSCLARPLRESIQLSEIISTSMCGDHVSARFDIESSTTCLFN